MSTMVRQPVSLLVVALLLATLPSAVQAQSKKAIRALMVVGGCCHDYNRQKHTVTQGIAARCKTPIEWTIVHHTKGNRAPVYEEDLASKFDIVFHNECFAHEKDPEWIERVLAPHRKGVPGVVMHCSMHSYGFGRVQPWVDFLGVRSHGHGPKYPFTVEPVAPDHAILEGIGAWKTPKGELYRVSEVMKTATPLARAERLTKGEPTGEYDVCVWTNVFDGKCRVFGTTVGHHNETVETQQWMDTVSRGFLWALGRLDEDFRPVSQHDHEAALAKAIEATGNSFKPTGATKKPATDKGNAVQKNLASGAKVTASSEESNKNNLVPHAVDGNLNTRWCASSGSKPQWLAIDLGKTQHVRGVRIHWEATGGCAYAFKLEGSADGSSWKTLHDASNNRKDVNGVAAMKVDAPNTKHLRVTYLGSSTGAWGSIREVEVYDTDKFPGLKTVAQGGGKPSGPTTSSVKDVKAPSEFEVTMFAAPPKVNYPVCIAADLDGTLYVGVDPNGSLGKKPGLGHITRCIDTDDDGVADKFTKFTDVRFPRGLFYDRGQLWVQHPPTITLYTDKDGDGVADESRDIVTGISTDLNEKRGADHTTNGMRMGIDGWLYIAVGDFGFVKATGTDGESVQLYGGGVARVRPDGSELEVYARGTRNICDIAVDPYLNVFARDNTNDGGGWDVRLHHVFGGHAEHGYPSHYKNLKAEMIHPLADYGGGSGTGALYIAEPGFGDYSDALLTIDWGRSRVFHHPLTPDGANFKAEQEDFVQIPRPTDADVDGAGRLFIASWKNGKFSYSGDDVGFVARLVHKDRKQGATAPNLAKASDGELLTHLASPSHTVRLYTQREILRRGSKPAFRDGLVKLAGSSNATLGARVAAIYTYKQLLGNAATDGLAKLTSDAKVRAHALRALADRKTQNADVPTRPFIDALADADPRVRLQAAIGLGRLGKPDGAEPLTKAIADADPLVAHAAVKSLVALGADRVALAALDRASEKQVPGLIHALQSMHTPVVVDGLIQRLNSASNATRVPIFGALCRLYHTEHEWTGSWWGTRPDTRGPYYKPTTWSASDRIGAALLAALKSASTSDAATMIGELMRNRVSLPGTTDVLLKMADAGESQRGAVLQILSSQAQVPNEAIALLKRIAADNDASPAHRAEAIRALAKSRDGKAKDATLAALGQMMSADNPSGEAVTVFEQYVTSKDRTRDVGYFTKAAKSGDAGVRQIAYATLISIAHHKSSKGKWKKQASDAVGKGFADDKALPAVLTAVGRTRNKTYENQVCAAVANPRSEVRDAALFAARALRLTNIPGIATGDVIAKLPYKRVVAEAMKAKGDAKEGEKLFTQQGCVACHTVTKDQPPKGPMLADIGKRYSRTELIDSIVKPSATIAQGFDTHIFVLKDGTAHVGFVTREAGDEIEIRNIAGLPATFKAGDVKSRTKQPNSMMPEGLVGNLTTQQLASLLAYLEALKSK